MCIRLSRSPIRATVETLLSVNYMGLESLPVEVSTKYVGTIETADPDTGRDIRLSVLEVTDNNGHARYRLEHTFYGLQIITNEYGQLIEVFEDMRDMMNTGQSPREIAKALQKDGVRYMPC